MPSSGAPAEGEPVVGEGEAGGVGLPARVVLLVDTHPTMQMWWDELDTLRDKISQLDLGEVVVRPLDLARDPAADALPAARLLLVVSNGASPGWRRARTKRTLRTWGRQFPLAILHMLPHPQWCRTGIVPDPVRLRRPGVDTPFAGWSLESTPAGTPTTQRTDLVPVPVFEFSDRSLAKLALLVSTEDQVRTAALLVPEPADDAEPPVDDTDPKAVVDDFRASVSPTTFRLATYLAAVPLDMSVMQGIRSRLLPRSSTANLAEVLSSPMVRAQPMVQAQPQPGSSLHVGFAFESGVRTELLATARRSDIEQVVRAVGDAMPDRPGASTFTTVLDPPPAVLPPLDSIDPDRRRDELAWRQVRVQVLLAMGGAHHRQGLKERAELPGDGSDAPEASPLPPMPVPPTPADSPATSGVAQTPRQPAEGRPVSSNVQDPQPPTPAPTVRPGAPSAGSRAVVGDFPLRHQSFTGRGDLLTALNESLRSGETTAVLPHALHGMGGVGKSLLAIEYIYRHQDDYDVVWWIPSERTTRIQGSLVELGQRLRLNAGNQANAAVPIVLEALSRGEPYGRWLLVYDNAESPEQVQEFLPRGGPGHVLITSRDSRWTRWARPLEVNVFAREESKQLLRRRGPDITDAEADALAEALGDLPLAIEQAAAWHAETGMPAQEYLRLLDNKQLELLDQPASSDYPATVIAAWNVSLDQLEVRNPAALELLQVCSFFAVEPIPRALFAAARGQDLLPRLNESIAFSRALRDISRYSLARFDHRTNAIQIHRLVQAALIARMSAEEQARIRDVAHRILAANDPDDPDSAEQYRAYGTLYPHVLASAAISSPRSWVRALVINEARYLYSWGDHTAAVELGLAARAAWSAAYGAEDLQTLEMACWLGFHLWSVGRYAEAAALNDATLDAYERLRATGHPDRHGELQAQWNVGLDRHVQGEFAEALRIFEGAYERAVREMGEDDPDSLNTAHNLAVSLRLSGQFARARDLDEETYNRKVEVFGPDHFLTLITRLGLLLDLRELGDYLNAERLSGDELARAEFALGDLATATLSARRLLAVAQRKAGHHEAARTTSELVCEQYRSRYHDTLYPLTMAAESGYAIDLRQVGDLAGAQQLGEDLVARYTQSLGADHPHTLSAQVNLAITHRLRGEPRIALEIDSAAFAALVRRLGPDHPSTLVAATNLASDLSAVGDRAGARERDEDTLTRLVAVLGAEHPTTLACESNLAIDLRAVGRDEEAEERFRHAAAALESQLGAEHPAVVQAESWVIRADCDLDLMPL